MSIEQYEEVINIVNPCMDDFLYILDLKNDYYCISQSALARFPIPATRFENATATFRQFVHADDIDVLNEDVARIIKKEQDFHNLQYRWMDKEGKAVWINCRGRVLLDKEGNPEFLIGCINEIGKKQKADNVSGLLGEFSLQNEIGALGKSRLGGFILRLGIDNFKEINENKGMDYGDRILRKTAECIKAVTDKGQKLYRIVADEFIVMDFNGSREDAQKLYKKIREQIDSFIEENGYEVFYTISAGILNLEDVTEQSYVNLMKLSEFALNKAKEFGKNTYYIYVKNDYHAFLHKRRLIHLMRQAVNHDFEGFEAYFQPIIDIKENRLCSAETLLRFHTEETGMVSPGEFIPLLEESGLIIPVGRWVLHQAMIGCSRIQKIIPDFRVSVNLSYIQVLKSDVLSEILEAKEKYGLPEGSILIELTESGFLESDANFISFCDGLRKNGIPLALDDFGTGYSNFHYLYNLNPNTIKIDRSFTLKALNSDYEYNLLQHMVEMTHSIDLKLCIEGIETKEELDRICEISPDYIQGFYFGRPSPLNKFLEDYAMHEQ
ncbi:MAG: GGDEF and EAL domain-containing protein [Lachnospiraceae bacterium]|nr:GGDEF and EAL domain-containing protein [Lachnospiraceae bacterium]